ncbi:PAC2 family protein [Actinobacteria bacterium YIM 96077]|uniref:PAC2 family protein n=1 Tax=Phytoactinopolyspora halophila TaxID=1981511 RepID=A0A329QL44_9ACTN|nr:PAC2 family protein [Phytoactinopolyspora halophila]AYY13526.1 PAC2 family protein [Actinobacteria bacterium YIM 96077]RAW12419.1 PAC2 family protein [Phytoactinopolyspora halophila]
MPEALYELVNGEAPEFENPVLLYHFSGFIDAGHAGGGIAEHLLENLEHTEVARFDTDQLVDYRSRRPEMRLSGGMFTSYAAPQLTLQAMRDDGGSPFLLLYGPEPDVRWEAFVAAVKELIEHFGVRLVAGFHGIPAPTPHTRPIGVTAHATRPGLLPADLLIDAELEVPGSASSLLQYRLGEWGQDAVGLVARVPHYLSEAHYPQSSVSLLRSLSSATGLLLPVNDLLEASEEAEQQVQEQVENNEQVARVVQALESQYDAFEGGTSRGNLLAEPKTLPTADEIGADFERFLAELDVGDDRPDE